MDELQKAVEMGIIDIGYIRIQMEEMKRKDILKIHANEMWHNDKLDIWMCYLPDETKPNGRRQIRRKLKSDLEDVIYEFYTKAEEADKPQPITVAELYDNFMEYKANMVAQTTIKRMKADWKRFFAETDFASKEIHDVKKTDIDILFNCMITENEVKDRAFRNACGLIKQLFEYAVDTDLLDESPYRVRVNKKEIVRTRKRNGSEEVFSEDETDKLFPVLENYGTKFTLPLAILLDFETGLRKAELLALKLSDIDFEKETVQISRQLVEELDDNLNSSGWKVVEHTKSDTSRREVPLTEKAFRLIMQTVRLNERNNVDSSYLFVNENGNFYTPDAADYWLRKSCKTAQIPCKSMHKIRKTYASKLYRAGLSVPVIGKMLGHADDTTTMKHYIFDMDKDDEMRRKVVASLQN